MSGLARISRSAARAISSASWTGSGSPARSTALAGLSSSPVTTPPSCSSPAAATSAYGDCSPV